MAHNCSISLTASLNIWDRELLTVAFLIDARGFHIQRFLYRELLRFLSIFTVVLVILIVIVVIISIQLYLILPQHLLAALRV